MIAWKYSSASATNENSIREIGCRKLKRTEHIFSYASSVDKTNVSERERFRAYDYNVLKREIEIIISRLLSREGKNNLALRFLI